MNLINISFAFLVSILLSRMVIPKILVIAFRKKLFDMPDERKVHQGIVPRLGGISFFPIILFSFMLFECMQSLQNDRDMLIFIHHDIFIQLCFLICGLILLFMVGIADDLVGVRYRQKFLIQFLAAVFFPLGGLWINNFYGLFGLYELSPWFGMPFTVLMVVFITNSINLIDGIDGLASGLSMVACLIFGCLFVHNQVYVYAAIAFILLGVLLPFFYFNVFGDAAHCRKIFMGDTGSLTLGYLLAFLAIKGSMFDPEISSMAKNGLIVAFAPLIIPCFDVLRVVFLRARKHKGLFLPDRNHIHHKFLKMGFSHRKSMILIIFMSLVFSCFNIVAVRFLDNNIVLIIDITVWIALHLWFDYVIKSRQIRAA